MNDEVLHYRFKKLEAIWFFGVGLAAWLVAATIAVLAPDSQPLPHLYAVTIFLIGALYWTGGLAMFENGYSRAFIELFTDVECPPLSDWSDKLEQEGRFDDYKTEYWP